MISAENSSPDANQVEPIAEPIQTELSYQRADGTIEIARSPEEAIAMCSYLGSLPLEQAKLLLDLSRKGQETIAENNTKTEAEKAEKEAPLIKTKEQSPAVATPKKNEAIDVIDTIITPEAKTVLQEERLRPEVVIASNELAIVLKTVNETLLSPKTKDQELVISNVPTDKKVDKPVIKEVRDGIAPHITSLNKAAQPTPKAEAIIVEKNVPIEIVLHKEGKLPLEEVVLPIIQAKTPELVEIKPRSETIIQQVSEEIVIDHEQAETESTAEDIFDELIEILGLSEADFIEVDIKSPLLDLEPSEQEASLEVNIDAVFENYINLEPAAETPVSIEEIRAKAEDQPLEVSLHQLVSLIAEASPQNETLITEIFELTEIFAVIEDESSTIKFDAEVLSKILSLLELIGYENPEKSLLNLVARYDLRFLISAMRYLHELSDPRKRQEFSITTFLKPIVGSVINPLAEIIGKTVMKLLQDSETPLLAY